jgi:hypothetical protein
MMHALLVIALYCLLFKGGDVSALLHSSAVPKASGVLPGRSLIDSFGHLSLQYAPISASSSLLTTNDHIVSRSQSQSYCALCWVVASVVHSSQLTYITGIEYARARCLDSPLAWKGNPALRTISRPRQCAHNLLFRSCTAYSKA